MPGLIKVLLSMKYKHCLPHFMSRN
ncbi:hypothetical protein QNN00_20955 [Bacillus velezensis]|nr:hypothetical protein [Bacillus velezensis]